MEKYLAVVLNNIKKNFVYRINNLITVISISISFVVLFYFWNSIYRQGNQIGMYSLNEMISYYVLVASFQLIMSGDNTAWGVGFEINSGQLTNNILKPISYLKYKMAQSIGNLLYKLMIFLPVILVVLFFIRNYLTHARDFKTYILFSICAMLSYILYFLVYFCIGITAFWTGQSTSIFWTSWLIINFLQGMLIPLDILPKWFITLSDYLPFKYLFYMPVGLLTGRINFDFSMILVPLLWGIGIYWFGQFLYLRGIKKYEGYGV